MKIRNFALSFAVGVVALTGAGSAAVIDLGFSLDRSSSVGSIDYNSARTALSQALGSIPTSGDNQYRIAVTSFAGGSTTIVAPTIVSDATLAGIQSDVANAPYSGGGTNIAGAISNLFGLFQSSADGLGATTLLNITTDGGSSVTASKSVATAARTAGLDGLSFEAVGPGPRLESLRQIAGLGTVGDEDNGVIVDLAAGDTIPDATATGFVVSVSDFDAYAGAIGTKINQVVDDTGGEVDNPTPGPSVVPLPAGLPLILTGLVALLGLGRFRRPA
ncbi:VWA domain-containing protein [uncultured Jannaschia sp.]|uniref:VWA domain-containing protein n=1 Tax=uncultured Jannaschia sp. TaxID=293347 RepID=UPI00260736E5|nr:VWA domain-containing protein [uncultured Jannaschia sp.]